MLTTGKVMNLSGVFIWPYFSMLLRKCVRKVCVFILHSAKDTNIIYINRLVVPVILCMNILVTNQITDHFINTISSFPVAYVSNYQATVRITVFYITQLAILSAHREHLRATDWIITWAWLSQVDASCNLISYIFLPFLCNFVHDCKIKTALWSNMGINDVRRSDVCIATACHQRRGCWENNIASQNT